ncbi:MAG: methyltransferase domain-containing protein [Chloroflexi bacterium]|nr:methyltransferase domain-containing protein [Chloroflexota bacterium]
MDLVFSVDVIHHVSDFAGHYRAARRVLRAGGKLCTATDSEWIIRHRRPLAVYFPENVEVDLSRYHPIPQLRAALADAGFGDIHEEIVELGYDLADAGAYRSKSFSCLHLISEDAFRRGIERLEADLRAGPIPCLSRYLLLWGTT